MLRASIMFFAIGLIAYFLGANHVAGLSVDLGKLLLIVFAGLAMGSMLAALISGRKVKILS
jgi:hypothetical protein